MKRKKSTSIVPFAVVLGAAALGAVVFAQNGKSPVKAASNTSAQASKNEAAIEITKADRKPLSFYTGSVRNDLFGTVPEPPKPKVEPIVVKPAEKAPPPVVVDPFEDYTYSGTMTMGGEPIALIENKKTREGEYKKIGEEFMGSKITHIDDNSVTLEVGGKARTLAKNGDYSLTPLGNNATFMDKKPDQPGVPGMQQPGANGNPMGGMNFGNMQNMSPQDRRARFQQMFQNMTPEQRDQMRQRGMNRRFNRSGGGGGAFGGGGGFGMGGFGG